MRHLENLCNKVNTPEEAFELNDENVNCARNRVQYKTATQLGTINMRSS